MSEKREFDPGLDTPTAYQPGAGFPVEGSPAWLDAENRKRIQEDELKAQVEAANNPQRVDEGGQPATNPAVPANEGKIDAKLAEINTEVTDRTAADRKAARAAKAEKDAADKQAAANKQAAAKGEK